MNETTLTGTQAAGVLLVMMAFAFLVFIFYAIPAIICYWKLFKKASKGGWEAIVPIYSTFVMAKIGKKPMWMAAIAAVAQILASSTQKSGAGVSTLFSLVALVFGLIILVNFFKQYTISGGHAVLVVLLPIIAVFTLGKVEFAGAVAAAPQAAAQPVAPVAPVAPVQQPQAFASQQPAPYAPPVAPQPEQPAPQAPVDQQNQQQ